MKTFFAELKRRNVVKVGVAYAVVAWAVLQFVDIVQDPLSLPEWFQKVTIVLIAIGFPLALVFSWAYELTPEGVKKTEEVDKQKSIAPRTGQKINKLIIGGLALVVVFFVYDKFIADTPVSFSDTEREASIAVLPFADLSANQDQGYFADGISEEILNVLAQIPDMKVAGRTSSFKFKGRNEDLRVIGEQLGVAHVLEGSVRKDGGRIRITVQLVAADDGFHIWSETYDRQDVDIFAIQDEISKAVAEALQVKLGSGQEQLVEQETGNPEAYSLYLRARQYLHTRGADNLEKAGKLFDVVTILDPEFDEAYSGMARALSLLVTYRATLGGSAEAQRRGKAAAATALELNPRNAEAYSALSYINMQQMDWAEAEKNNLMATTLAPNDAEVANFAGDYSRFVGDYANAIKWEKRALELDPLHVVNAWDLAFANYEFGHYEEGLPNANRARELDPGYPYMYQAQVYILSELGRFDDARAMIADAEANKIDPLMIQDYKTYLASREGPDSAFKENLEKLENIVTQTQAGATWVFWYYLDTGEIEKGLEWYEKAYREHDPLLVTIPKIIPELYTSDPALIARFELPGMKELFDIRRKHRANGNGPKQ